MEEQKDQSQTVNVNVNVTQTQESPKNRLAALLLCIFLGELGIHRFYVGKVGTGILWLISGGVFFIGYIVDIIMIACGSFTDKQGLFVKNWGN